MKRILLIVLVTYLGYGALIYCMQRSLIYPGTSLPSSGGPGGANSASEVLALDLPGGKLLSRFMPAADGQRRPAVLICHGNMELAQDLFSVAQTFNRMGVGVLLLEYPGFGGMPGVPSEKSLTETAVAAYDLLAARSDVDAGRIVAMGRSLGSGVACALSVRRPLRGLILVSAFTSLRPFTSRYLLPSVLLKDIYDNQQALRRYPGNVLIVHGRQDPVVPFSHGERLALTAARPMFVAVDAGHNDAIDHPGFWKAAGRYLAAEGIIALPR